MKTNCFRHCALCENEILTLKKGVICKHTNIKPSFYKLCSSIQLEEKFEEKLALVSFELQELLKDKHAAHFKFYSRIIIGFILIIGSGAFVKFLLVNNDGFNFLFYQFGLISFGITLISAAYFKFNKFRDKLRMVKFNKKKIDDVLDLYKIDYTSEILLGKKVHGTQKVKVKLKFQNRHIEETLTLLEIDC